MALTSFHLYPTSVFDTLGGRIASSNAANVDDPEPITSHDGVATYDAFYGFSGSTVAGGITYGLSAPPAGMTINKIRICGAFFISNAGPDAFATDPEVTVCLRPSGSSTYYTAAATLVGGTASVSGTSAGRITGLGFYNRNTASWTGSESPGLAYWEWSTNPVTGTAWTLSDLANLKVGYFCDGSKGSPTYTGQNVPISSNLSYVCATALWVWVEATTVAASIESERAKGSQFLRMFRKPVRKFTITVPPEFASIDVGDTFVLDHDQGPHPSGDGWGKKDWQRREAICIGTSVNPSTREVTLTGFDVRDFRCGLWSTLVTDIGFSEDGNGIPILHQGLGLSVATGANYRNATVYVKKQTDDPTFAACGEGKGLWTPSGLWPWNNRWLQPWLNSTFSQYSGGFTSWTKGGTGSWAQDSTRFLIDADGFRQGCRLTTGTSQNAYVYQYSASLTGSSTRFARVRVRWYRTAAGTGDNSVYAQIVKSGTPHYLDSAGAWTASVTSLTIGDATLGSGEWVSPVFPLDTTTTYGINVGLLGSSSNADLTLTEVTMQYTGGDKGNAASCCAPDEPVLPTTTAANVALYDNVHFPVRDGIEVREERGTMLLAWIPSFDHGDLKDGDIKLVWNYRKNCGLEYMRCRYERVSSTSGRLHFDRYVASATSALGTLHTCYVSLATTGDPTTAQRGQRMGLAFRWTSASDELDLGVRQMKIYCIPRLDVSEGSSTALISATTTYTDFTSRGISISDATGGSGNYGNSWTRTTAGTDDWTHGWSTKTSDQRITAAGGGVAFMPKPEATWANRRFMVGLDNADPNKNWDTIDYALYFNSDGSTVCQGEARSNGSTALGGFAPAWSNHFYGGLVGRVQVESGNVTRWVVGTTAYSASYTPTFPLYVDASFATQYAEVLGVCLYGSAVAGTFGDSTTIEPGRIELGGWIGVDGYGYSAYGAGAFQNLELTPYVLTDEEVERRMRG